MIKSKHVKNKSKAKLSTVISISSVEEQKGVVTGGEVHRRIHEKIAFERSPEDEENFG